MSTLKRHCIIVILSLFTFQTMSSAGMHECLLGANYSQVELFQATCSAGDIVDHNLKCEKKIDSTSKRKQIVNIVIASVMCLLIGGLCINFAVDQK